MSSIRVVVALSACVAISGALGAGTARAQPVDPLICEYQSFPDFCFLDTGAPGIQFGHVDWGDIDRDGDMDLIIQGSRGARSSPAPFQEFYRNDGEEALIGPPQPNGQPSVTYLTDYSPFFESVALPDDSLLWDGSNAFGDINNDGYLDVVVTGATSLDVLRTDVYVNRGLGDVSMDISQSMIGLRASSVAFGDADNDGDLDLAMSGLDDAGLPRLWIAENDGTGLLSITDTGLPGAAFGRVIWGDHDNDGDADLLVSGISENEQNIVRVYQNNAGSFVDTGTTLSGALFAAADWGDYDGDGDLDVLVAGGQLDPFVARGIARVFRNDGGTYTEDAVLDGTFHGTAAWVDYDSDGDLDAFVSGGQRVSGETITIVLRNDGGSFVRAYQFGGGLFGDAALGDYDGDGDVDVLLFGVLTSSGVFIHQYRNEIATTNQAPSAPSALVAIPGAGTVNLSWTAAADDLTPSAGLTYNLRVGTSPGGNEVVPSMAEPATGKRLITARGNVDHNLSWSLTGLGSGTYYWSVQALDASGIGSPFALEQTFIVP